MMLGRRTVLALVAAVGLTGCASDDHAPMISAPLAETLRVTSLDVYPSSLRGIRGRETTQTPAQVVADIKAAIQTLVAPYQGARPVVLQVAVNDMALASASEILVLNSTSRIRGKIRVVDARTGAEIIKLTEVIATPSGFATSGAIGALATKAVDEDYRAIVATFAQAVERRLFGATKK